MKKVREGYKMTELGEIPEEWKLKQLREVVDINPESLGNKTNEDFILNYIDIESVTTGVVNNTKEYSFGEAPSRARRKVRKNDVIISTVRPYLKAFAIIKDDKKNLVCSTGFAVLRAKDDIDFQYIYHYALSDSFLNQLSNKMVGSNYPAVNSSDVQETLIAIPSIREQQKISLILSSVDKQIENTDNLIEKTKELKKGLRQRLLTKGIGHKRFKETEIGRIPEEWKLQSIGEVAKFQGGYAFKSSDYVEVGIKLIKITNVQQNNLVWDDISYLPEEFIDKYLEYKLNYNDVVMAMTRPIISKGIKVCRIKHQDVPSFLNQRVGRFVVNDKLDSGYLYQYAFSNYFINKVSELSSTTGQPNISSKQIESILIPVPGILEQKRISSILSSIDEQIGQYEFKKEKFQTLKKGLMQKLLTGKIRVNHISI